MRCRTLLCALLLLAGLLALAALAAPAPAPAALPAMPPAPAAPMLAPAPPWLAPQGWLWSGQSVVYGVGPAHADGLAPTAEGMLNPNPQSRLIISREPRSGPAHSDGLGTGDEGTFAVGAPAGEGLWGLTTVVYRPERLDGRRFAPDQQAAAGAPAPAWQEQADRRRPPDQVFRPTALV